MNQTISLFDLFTVAFLTIIKHCPADGPALAQRLADPALYAPIRRFLRRDLVSFQAIVDSRAGRPPIKDDWYRRIWLYRNLDPNAMPELERLLQEHLERNIALYKQKATDAAAQAVKVRDTLFPGIPLVLG